MTGWNDSRVIGDDRRCELCLESRHESTGMCGRDGLKPGPKAELSYHSGQTRSFGKYMYFRQLLTMALVCAFAALASAGTIVVDVRDPKAAPLLDAVVYAAPEGREMPPAARAAVMDQKNKTFI